MSASESVRKQIRNYMQEQGISQAELARQMGRERQDINNVLQRRGIAKNLEQVLDHLGLELKVEKKR